MSEPSADNLDSLVEVAVLEQAWINALFSNETRGAIMAHVYRWHYAAMSRRSEALKGIVDAALSADDTYRGPG